MKIFVDTADSDRIKELFQLGVAYGTTTNPSILKKNGFSIEDVPELSKLWRSYGAQEMGFQATGTAMETIVSNGEFIASQGDDVFVKVPATVNGFGAASSLIHSGANVLITAIYSISQVVMASAIGAKYVSPYLEPLEDISSDGLSANIKMNQVLHYTDTEMLAAGISSANVIASLAQIGVGKLTAPPDVIVNAITSQATEATVASFEEDINS